MKTKLSLPFRLPARYAHLDTLPQERGVVHELLGNAANIDTCAPQTPAATYTHRQKPTNTQVNMKWECTSCSSSTHYLVETERRSLVQQLSSPDQQLPNSNNKPRTTVESPNKGHLGEVSSIRVFLEYIVFIEEPLYPSVHSGVNWQYFHHQTILLKLMHTMLKTCWTFLKLLTIVWLPRGICKWNKLGSSVQLYIQALFCANYPKQKMA